MKRRITTLACILAVCLLLSAGAWAGDGQIDIAEIPYNISSSGSYIVVDDLSTTATDTDGITIDADNVTLDLNGHALIGPGKAAGTIGSGIYVASPTKYNIAIRNGTLRDWRQGGVNAAYADNSQFEALRCYNNGAKGIDAGRACTVSNNTCHENGGNGIETYSGSTVSGNSSLNNTGDGINAYFGSTVSNNSCRFNTDDGIWASTGSNVSGNSCANNEGDGIQVVYGSTVSNNSCSNNVGHGIHSSGTNCTIIGNACHGNDGDGILAYDGCTVRGNTCCLSTGDGIQVGNDCRVVDNNCDSNGNAGDGAGILATGSENRITNNHCTDNDRGLDLDGADNIVSGNTLRGNTTPLDAVAGNQLDILISELPYTISQPGMYRLSGNLSLSATNTHGVTIDADDVTLDLNGHSLTGPGKAAGTSGNGIYVNGAQYNITIRNGSVRDWRGSGIYGGLAYNSQFEGLRCYNNGGDGIYSGTGPLTVRGNTCYNNGGDGIQTGFGCTVTDNACRNNGGDGINADNSSVRGNACYGNTGDGIEASNSLVAENCCMANGTNLNLTTCTAVNNKS